MGLFKMSASALDSSSHKSQPDPKNYTVERIYEQNGYIVLWLKYPDCTNFEGSKILVYKNVTLSGLLAQRVLDPHFSDNLNYIHPIARFIPTEYGWNLAKNFIHYN